MLGQLWENFWLWYDRARIMVEGANSFQRAAQVSVRGISCFRLLRDHTRSMAGVANQFEWIVIVFALMAVEAMFVLIVGMAIQGHQGWSWKLLS